MKVVINLLIGQNNLAFYSMKIQFDISKIAKSGNRHREMGEEGGGRSATEGWDRKAHRYPWETPHGPQNHSTTHISGELF